MQSYKIIQLLVVEIFKGFYHIWVTILVMKPGPFILTFAPPSQGGSTLNLALIGQAVLEWKIFKNGGRPQDDRCRWTPEHGNTICSLCEPDG